MGDSRRGPVPSIMEELLYLQSKKEVLQKDTMSKFKVKFVARYINSDDTDETKETTFLVSRIPDLGEIVRIKLLDEDTNFVVVEICSSYGDELIRDTTGFSLHEEEYTVKMRMISQVLLL